MQKTNFEKIALILRVVSAKNKIENCNYGWISHKISILLQLDSEVKGHQIKKVISNQDFLTKNAIWRHWEKKS